MRGRQAQSRSEKQSWGLERNKLQLDWQVKVEIESVGKENLESGSGIAPGTLCESQPSAISDLRLQSVQGRLL